MTTAHANFVPILLAAMLVVGFTSPSAVEGKPICPTGDPGMTCDEQERHEEQNRSYNKGYEDGEKEGFEKGMHAGESVEKAAHALEKMMDPEPDRESEPE
jgi:hypothetical protein